MLLSRFIAKLQTRTILSYDDVAALGSLPGKVKSHASQELVKTEETDDRRVGFLLSGFLSTSKLVQGNKRQIVGFILPGDAIDVASILTNRPNAHALAHGPSVVFWALSRDVSDLCAQRPNVANALWLDTLIDAGISREWIANIGQRRATDRTAHLLLELATRYGALDGTFHLPLSQSYLASALGLSLVHLNKSLCALEREGLIARDGHNFRLPKWAALQDRVGFDARYLWAADADIRVQSEQSKQTLQLA